MPTPTGTSAPPQTKTLESRVPGSVMVDIAAPPVPNRSNPLRKPTHAEATSKLKTGMGILIFGLAVGGALLYFGFKILGGAALLFFGGGGLAIVLGRKDEVAACPFCGAVLDSLPKPNSDNVPRPVQCKKCWEYSGLQKGSVSPYNPNRSEEHTSELQSHSDLVCRLLLEKKKPRRHGDPEEDQDGEDARLHSHV